MNNMNRKAVVLVAIILIFFLGMEVGERRVRPSDLVQDAYNINGSTTEPVDFEPFWKVWNIINERYAGSTTTVSAEDKMWGAIEGLANSLGDPYTVFLPPDDTKIFEELITGTFSGVGMEIGERKGILTVIAP